MWKEIVVLMEIQDIFNTKNIIIYFILMNLIAFSSMLLDKKKAENGKWRIKESTLLILALIGGSVGELFGMFIWHHKTQKFKFLVGVPMIIILQILIIIFFIMWLIYIKHKQKQINVTIKQST